MVNVVAEYNGAGQLSAAYTHGLGLEARVDANGSDYYDFDALGSTAGLTNTTGAVVNRYSYLPFGENVTTTETVANPFEYVGQWGVMDAGNGLDFMRARFYDANAGRFISNDPLIQAGKNSYAYTENNPISFYDASGLCPTDGDGSGDVSTFTLALRFAIRNSINPAFASFGPITGSSGCGDASTGWIVPDRLLWVDLGNACDHHDAGYGTIGRPKDVTDEQFFNDIQNSGLGKYDPLAYSTSWLYWAAVHFGADKAYNDAQLCKDVPILTPKDPNDILHPEGFGADHWLTAKDAIPYTIRFENQATATAPAQEVTITQTLGGCPTTSQGWKQFYCYPENFKFPDESALKITHKLCC